MKDQGQYAVGELYSWFKANQDYFLSCGMDIEFKDTGENSASVNLESSKHIVQLCAWDHASCLDIQILDVASEESIFPHAGECKTQTEFVAELSKFLDWQKTQY